MIKLCQDSLATILICSDLGLSVDMKKKYRPYTVPQWNKLVDKIVNSSLKSPSALLESNSEVLRKELFLNSEELERLKFLLSRGGNIAIEIEQLVSKGIYITTRAEANYPQRFKSILKKQSPPIIFYSGDLSLANREGISIVGSRDVDEEGIIFTKKIASKASKEGYVIISGGAKGVDSIAENTSIEVNGCTVSIVANNLSNKIRERHIRNAILEGKMLLLSTVNPDARFSVYSAMDRNKYIYALAQYVIAISSTENRGGTWTGAVENLKKAWVPLFVRSGENIPLGNKKLLELGGKPISMSCVENSSESIKDFFVNSIKGEYVPEDYKQINIYNIDTNLEDKASKVMEVNETVESQDEKHIDLYDVVLPYIKKALQKPKNQKQLSDVLNVNKSQISNWINRALEEEEVLKLTNPVRYTLSDGVEKL